MEVNKNVFQSLLKKGYASYKIDYWLGAVSENTKKQVKCKDSLEKLYPEYQKTFKGFQDVACFSAFHSYKQNKNILVFKCKYTFFCEKDTLHEYEKHLWVDLCKQYKLLPTNINTKQVNDGVFIVHFDPDKTDISQFYIYLISLRDMQEDPIRIKCVLYLYNKGIDFLKAIYLVSILKHGNIGHTLFHINNYNIGNIKFKDLLDNQTIDVSQFNKMVLFLKSIKLNKNKITIRNSNGFKLHDRIKAQKISKYDLTFTEFLQMDTSKK